MNIYYGVKNNIAIFLSYSILYLNMLYVLYIIYTIDSLLKKFMNQGDFIL